MRIHRGALVVATVAALVGGPLFGGLALAGNKHVDEAIEHAKEAVAHGKQGHADVLVKHAEGALKHAQGAQKDMKNPHLDEGVKQLNEAVAHGKAGHADVATAQHPARIDLARAVDQVRLDALAFEIGRAHV